MNYPIFSTHLLRFIKFLMDFSENLTLFATVFSCTSLSCWTEDKFELSNNWFSAPITLFSSTFFFFILNAAPVAYDVQMYMDNSFFLYGRYERDD